MSNPHDDVSLYQGGDPSFELRSAIDGRHMGQVGAATDAELDAAVARAQLAFERWRTVPAPRRGELVRRIGNAVRAQKEALAAIITCEVGKITAEAQGEVQEWIDLCDFAVGLSRQLHGLSIASERSEHRMMEQWHPLGPVGVITAFNFPVAVWAWNAMVALVCGDPVVWKPSMVGTRCAAACQKLVDAVCADFADAPPDLCQLLVGGADVGARLAASPGLPLISATGSVAMGRKVASAVGARLGRSLLELGGNNALIVTESADLDLAARAIVFSAVGTCGQRCTSLRRLLVDASIRGPLTERIIAAYATLPIGDPREPGTLVGPLISAASFERMQAAMTSAEAMDGGTRLFGGERVTDDVPAGGIYVRPAIVAVPPTAAVLREETFAPLLWVVSFDGLEQAIALNNAVPQGLSSAIFTERMREAERFLGPAGSDCGIANVNIGTSGAEIGGAFGGEKDTGGGRESGSDAWRAYMRRATNTINYGDALPLAQGITFGCSERAPDRVGPEDSTC